MVYAYSFLYNGMDVEIRMNTICLGCGDDMFANRLICEVCWNGEI